MIRKTTIGYIDIKLMIDKMSVRTGTIKLMSSITGAGYAHIKLMSFITAASYAPNDSTYQCIMPLFAFLAFINDNPQKSMTK